MKKRNLNIYFSFLIVFFFSCDFDKNSNVDFKFWEKNQFEKSFIRLHNGEASFYAGKPEVNNLMKGRLYQEKNKIIFISEQTKFTLFDFDLSKGSCTTIKYEINKINKKEYLLCNQDVFLSKRYKDTIYKFCYKYYEIFNKKNGIVYFVNKRRGIIGCYLVDYSSSDTIPSINKVLYGDTFSDKYNYDLYPRFTIK